MGIGGVRGFTLDMKAEASAIEVLFNEELGIVVEVPQRDLAYVLNEYKKGSVNAKQVGTVGKYGMQSEVGFFVFANNK